jgi:hypothetical protein
VIRILPPGPQFGKLKRYFYANHAYYNSLYLIYTLIYTLNRKSARNKEYYEYHKD